MFTGIIEEIGKIKKISPIPGGKRLSIFCESILDDLKVDDSVSVNGICLTAVNVGENYFDVEAVGETLTKTTINNFREGTHVNLERALKANSRLGGHFVMGHVNGIGKLTKVIPRGDAYLLEFSLPANLMKYCIDEGSIAINGISLTIAKAYRASVAISIIPHTWQNTVLRYLKTGDTVNVEVDMLAKYLERLISYNKQNSEFTIERLKEEGF
ncbi:MAG: riboflavin synthase [Ignavibacteria bacterium]|nr:MAG: riboflavin synthase [Ignavibacteria bacterium]